MRNLFVLLFLLSVVPADAGLGDWLKRISGGVDRRVQAVKMANQPAFGGEGGEVNFQALKRCFQALNFEHPNLDPKRFQNSRFMERADSRNINALSFRKDNKMYVIQDDKASEISIDGVAVKQERNKCDSVTGGFYAPVDHYDNSGDNSGDYFIKMRLLDFSYYDRQGMTPKNGFCSPKAAPNVSGTNARVRNIPQEGEGPDEVRSLVEQAIQERLTWIAQHMTPEYKTYDVPTGGQYNFIGDITAALSREPSEGPCLKVITFDAYLGGYLQQIQCAAGEAPAGVDCSQHRVNPVDTGPQGEVIER